MASERPARSIPVSVRARLPTRRACCSERAELAAGAADVLRGAQRDPDLTEHLTLADDHRVQPAGDREQVRHGAVLVVRVEVRGELVEVDAGMAGEQLGHLRKPGVEHVHLGVDLDAVAGGEHHRFAGVVADGNVVEQLTHGVRREDDPLQEIDRRGAVGQAHDQGAHVLLTCRPPGRCGGWGRAHVALVV